MRKPYIHQQKVLDQIVNRDKVALFIEMRLGKTLIAIRWAMQKKAERILIICPKSVMGVWTKELKEEGFDRNRVKMLVGRGEDRLKDARQFTLGTTWFVINNDGIVMTPEILSEKWDCIILDESTSIRNPKAKITNFLFNRTKDVQYKAILSGLPNPESVEDFFCQLRFLNNTFMKVSNFWQWRNTYFTQIGYSWEPKQFAEKKILEEVASTSILLKRKDAGKDCTKVYENRFVLMNLPQIKAYNEMLNDFETTIKDEFISTKFILPKLEFMYRIASGMTQKGQVLSNEKNDEILYLLQNDLKNESVVIWFKYNEEISNTKEFLMKHKIDCAIYTGGEKLAEDNFKSGRVKIMLAQAKCGQMGLNWSVASTAIYYSQWWDAEVRAQSEDRIVDINKPEPLLYIDLITKNTIDEDVCWLLKQKRSTSESFLNQLRNCLSKRNNKYATLSIYR